MFAKLLLTTVVVLLLLFGFRFARRLSGRRNEADAASRHDRSDRERPSFRDELGRAEPPQDLVLCESCQTFRPRHAGKCGRPGCPA